MLVLCEYGSSVGVDECLRGPPRVGKLCFDVMSGLVLLRAPTKRFSDFVDTHGEYNRNH